MRNYAEFKGKLIRMNKEYPIYSREDGKDDEVIGWTAIGDMAVITYADIKEKQNHKTVLKISDEIEFGIPVSTGIEEGYFETVIVSGKYIGVDSLALDLDDIADSTFIFNKIDGEMTTYIQDRKIKYEYV